MPQKWMKILFPVLLAAAGLAPLSGCATLSTLWARLFDPPGSGDHLPESAVARFVAQVRPPLGNPEAHYLLGCYYQERGREAEAVAEFQKVLRIDPEYVRAYNGLGVSYDRLGDFPRAMAAYRKALELNPALDYVQNNLGYSYLLQGRTDLALATLQEAFRLNPGSERIFQNLKWAWAAKEREEEKAVLLSAAGTETIAPPRISRPPGENIPQGAARAERPESPEGIGKSEAPVPAPAPGVERIKLPLPPPQAPSAAPEPLRTETQTAPPSPVRSELRIEVSNGNGVNRMARRIGERLREQGLKVVRLTNADHFHYRETKIIYGRGYYPEAEHVARQLGGVRRFVERPKLEWPQIQVRVLLGRDLASGRDLRKKGRSS